jgi:hypothetical protein
MSLDTARALLGDLRNDDGGYPPSPGAESEPEATAMAALALDDSDARKWLLEHQQDDGGVLIGPPALRNDSATALAALALDGAARERALDYLVAHRAQPIAYDERFPHDPETRGWGWTSLTFGWVEPTSRALLALKVHRPRAAEIADGIAVLVDRECDGGGWNYGNREVLDTMLEPFLQTSAAGLMAVQDGPVDLRERAAHRVLELWPVEQGGLGWSMALVALNLVGQSTNEHRAALELLVTETRLLDDTVALSWAVLGLGEGWRAVAVSP